MRAWSCITSYPLRGLPYLAYDNVNPAMVNSMMLRSSMLAFEKVYTQNISLLHKPLFTKFFTPAEPLFPTTKQIVSQQLPPVSWFSNWRDSRSYWSDELTF